jgi:hypothetical protein
MQASKIHPKQTEAIEAPPSTKFAFYNGIPWAKLDRTPAFPDTIMIPVIKQTEHEVCADLKKWWKDRGMFVIRNQQGIGSMKGVSDYTIIYEGRVAFVEAKATKGKQSPNQIAFQMKVEEAGGVYILAHSLVEFAEEWIKKWKL